MRRARPARACVCLRGESNSATLPSSAFFAAGGRVLGLIRSIYSRFERAARDRGYRITWAPRTVVNNMADRELGFDLEFVVAHLMLRKKDIFFIQIGANDGITNDPLYKFVTEFGWQGILVEPMPESFAALQETYRGRPDLILLNAALAGEDGALPIYTVRIDAGTFQKAQMYSSFDREVVLRNSRFVPDIAQRIEEVQVKAVSMKTLLAHAGSRNVDILAIDAEGFDYTILKMIDFARLKPAIILYEHTHLNKADQEAAAELLAAQGYRMTRDTLDTIGYRPSFTYGWRHIDQGRG
jgi:FkbM family methyltransferase